jgi:hypothetical protein
VANRAGSDRAAAARRNSVGVYLNVKEAPEISRESNQIYDNLEEDVRHSG